ncbi:MAG TPA: alcohol dehydrogenase catalytic domain-containing protein [Candidatus Binatia bacterium]|jgi:L-iditol 2-dehydrogenase
MKQVVLEQPRRLVLRDVADPVPGPEDVVVEVRAALTCGTDLKSYRRGHPKFPYPAPFGHEASGIVVASGSSQSAFHVGDALMLANSGPCGACFWCRNDEENLCLTLTGELLVGAYAEYLLVPARVLRRNAFVKPESMPFETAALLEPLSSVCFGLTRIPTRKVRGAATVLLIGSGPIAMLWLRALQAAGAERVIVAGKRPARLQTARSMGAIETISLAPGDDEALLSMIADATDGRGCDAVVECTGQTEVWESAPRYARRGASVVLFGGCAAGTTVSFDTMRLHYDGIELTSPFHFRPRDVAEARRLLSRDDLDWSPLVSGRVGLAEVPELFARLGDRGEMKIAVIPEHGAAATSGTGA